MRDKFGSQKKISNSLRFLKEVREDEAVYDIYLKKIFMSVKQKFLIKNENSSDDNENICNSDQNQSITSNRGYQEWKLEEYKLIKQGTLKELIRNLSNQKTGSIESHNLHVLIATYRTFCSSTSLLTAISNRFEEIENDKKMNLNIKQNHIK